MGAGGARRLLLGGVGAPGFALGGPPGGFSALPSAQLGYGVLCRAPDRRDKPPSTQFALMVGGSLALHAAALSIPPVRRLLQLPDRVGGSVLGVSAAALPMVAQWFADWWRRVARTPARSPVAWLN